VYVVVKECSDVLFVLAKYKHFQIVSVHSVNNLYLIVLGWFIDPLRTKLYLSHFEDPVRTAQ